MADYYSLMAKAVGALDANTAEARRKVYDRARAALLSELQKSVPAWDRSEIMAEQMFLELAIGEVEAELQTPQCDPRRLNVVTLVPADGASIKPKSPVNHNARRDRGSAATTRSRDVDQCANEARVRDRRPNSPTLQESDVQPVRDTWMTDLLARASDDGNENLQDFAPKRGSSRVGLAGRPDRVVHERTEHRSQIPNAR
jgi:hypothetical protein